MATLNVTVNARGAKLGATEARKAIKGIGEQATRTEKKLDRSTRRMGNSFKVLKSQALGLKSSFAALALAAGAFATVRIGANFEKSIARAGAVVRATPPELDRLTATAREMGAQTEYSATQAADALTFLGMAGFEVSESIAAIPGVLDLATASGVGLAESADIASNALTAMRLPIEDLSRVNDVFVGTITRSNTNMNQMAEAFKYAAPVASSFGYNIEQLSALIGGLGNAGVQGSMAGTQLAFAFTKVNDVWEKLGIDGTGKDLLDALEATRDAGWDTNDMLDIFGQRGGRAALILREMVPEMRKFEDTLKASEGEASKMADTMRDNLIGDFMTLRSTAEDLAIEMYNVFSDDLRASVQGMTKWLRENKDIMLELAETTLDVAQGIAYATAKAVEFVTTFTRGIKTLAGALGKFAGDKDLNLFNLLFNPGAEVGKLFSQAEDQINIQDFFTGEAGAKLADFETSFAPREEQKAQAAAGTPMKPRADSDLQERVDAEIAAANKIRAERERIEKETREAFAEMRETYGKSEYELELMKLNEQAELYRTHVQDKLAVEQWYQAEYARITDEEAARQAVAREKQIAEEKKAARERIKAEEEVSAAKTNVADYFATSWTNAFTSIIDGSKSVSEAMTDMARQIVADLAMMIVKALLFRSIMSVLPGGSAIMGFSGFLGGGFHTGGMPGFGGGSPRRIDPSIFAAAPRLHNGLRNDEYPAILQRGEEVKSKSEVENGEGSGITIYNVVDPELVQKAMASANGQKAVVNVIRGNSGAVNKALRGG